MCKSMDGPHGSRPLCHSFPIESQGFQTELFFQSGCSPAPPPSLLRCCSVQCSLCPFFLVNVSATPGWQLPKALLALKEVFQNVKSFRDLELGRYAAVAIVG